MSAARATPRKSGARAARASGQAASLPRPAKTIAAPRVAKPAPRAKARKPAAYAARIPGRTALVAQPAKSSEALPLVMPTASPPAPPSFAQEKWKALFVAARLLARLLARLWALSYAFLRGPGLAATKAAFRMTVAWLARLWAWLKVALRPREPKASHRPRRETLGELGLHQPEVDFPALPQMGRIPPHQRHLYAHLANG